MSVTDYLGRELNEGDWVIGGDEPGFSLGRIVEVVDEKTIYVDYDCVYNSECIYYKHYSDDLIKITEKEAKAKMVKMKLKGVNEG